MIRKIIPILFFLALFILGSSIYRDYGISADENVNLSNGVVNVNYIAEKLNLNSVQRIIKSKFGSYGEIETLDKYYDRDYGVSFEIPLILAELLVNNEQLRDMYLLRHFLTFFVFFLAVLVFYYLIKFIFKDWKLALVGSAFLVLSPRIFANSFYNSKDLTTMCYCVFSLFTLFKFIDKKNNKYAVLHGFTTAIFITIRVIGLYIVPITLLPFFIEFLAHLKNREKIFSIFKPILVFVISLLIFTFMFWPFLWESPVNNFILVLKNMSNFRWNLPVLYLGEFIEAEDLPWNYIFVWIFVTTPILYTVLFASGFFLTIKKILINSSQLFKNSLEQKYLIFLYLFFAPILAAIVLSSVVYDGWRQFYFLYPSFLLIAISGIYLLAKFKSKLLNYVLICLLSISLFSTGFFMIKNHPYQFVYFNTFVGKDIYKKFEMDYWAVSYYDLFQYLLEHEEKPIITVWVTDTFLTYNRIMQFLTVEERKRFRYVELIPESIPLNWRENFPYKVAKSVDEVDYVITNYRYPNGLSIYENGISPFNREVYSIKVRKNKIAGIYEINKN